MKRIRNLIILGVLTIIVIVVIRKWPKPELQPATIQPVAAYPSGDMIADDAVYAPDQPPGKTVVVPVASFKIAYGWVVIRESKDDGGAGNIIGHSDLISPGSVQRTVASLDRKSIDGEVLYAMLYEDDGDGEFKETDQPLRDANGNISTMSFTVDETLPAVE
ncbi:MAG: hypothetical protein NUV56_02335 [Candidatus Uhrbacteria bacterium]|nr:hypothetical protein [Candidatus Uhrbacteria bacterium]